MNVTLWIGALAVVKLVLRQSFRSFSPLLSFTSLEIHSTSPLMRLVFGLPFLVLVAGLRTCSSDSAPPSGHAFSRVAI